MKNKILAALLFVMVTGITACSGGTQTCRVTGLTAGQTYRYGYEDSDGTVVIGTFEAPGTFYDIPNVDAAIDCGTVGVVGVTFDLIAEGPVV